MKVMFGLAMTNSSEDSVELEAKVATTPRHSHHKSSRRKRIAARTALILGIAIGVLAISDFAYNAYERARGLGENSVVLEDGQLVNNANADTIDAIRYLSRFEDHQQLDAAAALLAAACVITSTVISRRIKKHRR
jgi:hypothetical protein